MAQKLARAFAGAPTVPERVDATCAALLMDVTGLCVAARNADYVRAVRATAEPGACTMIGHDGRHDAATTALVNGTAAHGEDYDDTFEGGPIHAGAVIVSAVLAAAERHGLGGADAIRGIAGSMASGIIEYLAEGTWTKRMHPGWAAQAGLRAARLAAAGFTGPRTVFEGEHGFFHGFAITDAGDFAAMVACACLQFLF